MSIDNQEQAEEGIEVEQTAEEVEKAIQAGYDKVNKLHDEPASIEGDQTGAGEEEAGAQTVDEVIDQPADNPEIEAKIPVSEEEMRTMFDRFAGLDQEMETRDQKVYGKFGEIQKTIKGLGESGPRKLLPEQLTRIKEQFGDEFATALAEDLSGITLGGSPAAEFDPAKMNEAVEERVAASNKLMEAKMLRVVHPDWRSQTRLPDVAGAVQYTPEFTAWGKTLSQGEFQKMLESQDFEHISAMLTEFKDWKKAASEKKVAAKQRSNERVEGAITPRGRSAPPSKGALPDEAGINIGYDRVRKQNGR